MIIFMNLEYKVDEELRMGDEIVGRVDGVGIDSEHIVENEPRVEHESEHWVPDVIVFEMLYPNQHIPTQHQPYIKLHCVIVKPLFLRNLILLQRIEHYILLLEYLQVHSHTVVTVQFSVSLSFQPLQNWYFVYYNLHQFYLFRVQLYIILDISKVLQIL